MKIIYNYGPSGMCPVQAEGTIDGHGFYFKARGSRLHLYVERDKKGFTTLSDSDLYYEEPYKCREHCGESEAAFAAGYATESECRAFIERAGELLLSTLNAY